MNKSAPTIEVVVVVVVAIVAVAGSESGLEAESSLCFLWYA